MIGEPIGCKVMNKKDQERHSTMCHEEATKIEEDMEAEVEDEEEVNLYATTAINQDILLGIVRILVQPVDIVMTLTMLLNTAFNCWPRCRKEETRELSLIFRRSMLRKGPTTREFNQ